MQSRRGGQRRALDSSNWRARPDNYAETGSARPAVEGRQNNIDSVPQAPPTNSDSDNPSNPHPENGDDATAAAIAAGRRIYVGNLPYHVRPRDVEELFGEAAQGGPYEITLLAMSVDPFTGRNPSYCFVELADRSQAESAMAQLNGTMVLGRPVRIKPCIPRTTERRKEWEESMLPSRWERTDAEKHFRGVGAEGRRLYIGGLSRPLNQPDSERRIRELFNGFNV
jgi:RNA recognition motif-containing protein